MGQERNSTEQNSYEQVALHKEIDLIQGCISRMANNCFLLKGWSITLLSGVFLLVRDINETFVLITMLIITTIFWGLDAYYLRLERMYREKYNEVLDKRLHKKNYDDIYDLNPNNIDEINKSNISLYSCLISPSMFNYIIIDIIISIFLIRSMFVF